MKHQPVIQPLTVKDYVMVDMQNGKEYVSIPTSNLDHGEIRELCENFVKSFARLAGYHNIIVNVTVLEEDEEQ